MRALLLAICAIFLMSAAHADGDLVEFRFEPSVPVAIRDPPPGAPNPPPPGNPQAPPDPPDPEPVEDLARDVVEAESHAACVLHLEIDRVANVASDAGREAASTIGAARRLADPLAGFLASLDPLASVPRPPVDPEVPVLPARWGPGPLLDVASGVLRPGGAASAMPEADALASSFVPDGAFRGRSGADAEATFAGGMAAVQVSAVASRIPRSTVEAGAPSPLALGLVIAGSLLMLVPGALLYHRLSPSLLREARRAIIDDVRLNPGTTAAGLARRQRIAYATARYHLDRLSRFRFVTRRRIGSRLCYFPDARLREEDARPRADVADGKNRTLLALVGAAPGIRQREAAARLGLAPSTICARVRRLAGSGLLTGTRAGLRLTPLGSELVAAQTPPSARGQPELSPGGEQDR